MTMLYAHLFFCSSSSSSSSLLTWFTWSHMLLNVKEKISRVSRQTASFVRSKKKSDQVEASVGCYGRKAIWRPRINISRPRRVRSQFSPCSAWFDAFMLFPKHRLQPKMAKHLFPKFDCSNRRWKQKRPFHPWISASDESCYLIADSNNSKSINRTFNRLSTFIFVELAVNWIVRHEHWQL